MLQLLPPVIEDSIPGNNIFQWGSFVKTTSRLDTINSIGRVKAENDSVNALIDKLNDISAYGIGHSDAIGTIAIPLIIGLIAFAVPFTLSIINNINDKYDSREITELFERTIRYRTFIVSNYLAVIVLVVVALITIFPFPNGSYPKFAEYVNSVCVFFAAFYAITILLFVNLCIRFNKPTTLLTIIDKKRGRDMLDGMKYKWTILKSVVASKWPLYSEYKRQANESALKYNDVIGDYTTSEIHKSRLLAVCKYTLKHQDDDAFLKAMESVQTFFKEEKRKCEAENRNTDKIAASKSHTLALSFMDELISYYCTCPENKKVEESLIWRCSDVFNKSMFVSHNDIHKLFQIFRKVADAGRESLLCEYIDKIRTSLNFIKRLPTSQYVKSGEYSDNVIKKNSKEDWQLACAYNYILVAYALSIGRYSVVYAVLSNRSYNRYSLLPISAAEVLFHYCNVVQLIDKDGRFNHLEPEKLIGYNVSIKQLINKLTALLFMLAPQDEELPLYGQIKRSTLDKIKSVGEDIIACCEEVKSDANITSHFGGIVKINVKNKIEATLKIISDANIGARLEHQNKDCENSLCVEFVRFLYSILAIKRSDKRESVFNAKLDDAVKIHFSNWLRNIRDVITSGATLEYTDVFYNESHSTLQNDFIAIQPYSARFPKLPMLSSDPIPLHQHLNKITGPLSSRFGYVLCKALSEMQTENHSVKYSDFFSKIKKHTNCKYADYVLIDFDSPLCPVVMSSSDLKSMFPGISYVEMERAAIFLNLSGFQCYERFDKKVVLIRKEDLPTLTFDGNVNEPTISLEDVSSEQEGTIYVDVKVDTHLQLRYNKYSTIHCFCIKSMM